MYIVKIDGEILSAAFLEDTGLIEPTVTLEANKAGSFTFGMAPDHPYYNSIVYHTSIIDVYQDSELLFEGVPVSESVAFDNVKTVECEGELSFLNDTIQRQASYTGKTAAQMLGEFLTVHNQQCDASKTFLAGSITMSDANLSQVTDYVSTMSAFATLVNQIGGYLRVRHYAGDRYLDYLAASPRTSSQIISLGRNLLDLVKNSTAANICTVVIPRGAKLSGYDVQGLDKRLDVKSVNAGKDYIIGTGAAYFGYVWKSVVFDNITTAADLLTAGTNYLTDAQWANLVIEAKAYDLGLSLADVQQFRILDKIRVVSDAHGLDRFFLLTKLELNLNDPGSSTVTLGEEQVLSLSERSAQLTADLKTAETRIDISAGENARQILESATGGNIYFVYDAQGVCTEIRIMDTNDPNTAQKIWRWNINGWGYSDDGGATYTLAATMNGTIIADFIKAGVLSGIEIQNGSGTFHVSPGGTVTAKDGKIGGFTINSHLLYNYDSVNDLLIGLNNQAGDTNWLALGHLNNGGDVEGTWQNCEFRVTKDGKLYATAGNISGSIVAGALTAASMAASQITNPNGTVFISFGSEYVQFNYKHGNSPWFVRIYGMPTAVTPTDPTLPASVYGLIYIRNGGTAYMYTDQYGLQVTSTLFNQ